MSLNTVSLPGVIYVHIVHDCMGVRQLVPLHLSGCRRPWQMAQDKFILNVGAQVGGCLVDGLGDGVMVQAPGVGQDMLRSVSFGLLQVKFARHGDWYIVIHTTRAWFSQIGTPPALSIRISTA